LQGVFLAIYQDQNTRTCNRYHEYLKKEDQATTTKLLLEEKKEKQVQQKLWMVIVL